MSKHAKILVAATLLLALTASVSAAKDVVLLKSQSKPLIIKLKANATTGFQWFYLHQNTPKFTLIKYYYQAPNKKLVGAPGQAIFIFQVPHTFYTGPQQVNLKFRYTRPWDSPTSGTVKTIAVRSLSS